MTGPVSPPAGPVIGAAVFCLLAAAVVAATVIESGGEDSATPAPAPSTLGQPAMTEPTTTSVVASTPPLVLASAAGVTVNPPGGPPVRVSTAPAAAAYGAGSEFVVFQNRPAADDSFPPQGEGPVRLWSAGTVRELPSGPGATFVRLLDAGIVEGRPVALVGERPPSTGPADSFEELVRIDLRDRSRTVVVRRPARESGHQEARLLPDGDVVGLVGSEGGRTVVRWRAGTTPPLWTVPVGFDPPVDLAVRGNSIWTVERATARDGTTLPLLTATSHDLATGRPGPPARAAIVDPGLTVRAGLFCPGWISPDELLCARRAGPPIAVTVRNGSSRDLSGERGAVATVLRV